MEFINLKGQYQCYKRDIDIAISQVLESGIYINGSCVKALESELSEYLQVEHAISCSSGTAALQLAFMACGIGQGDAVFCPDVTFVASIEPALLLGAKAILCDIDETSYNISPDNLCNKIEAVIAENRWKPKAVVAVDFVGNPHDNERIKKITQEYGLLYIEDAAQGIGASYQGKKCGSLGTISTTSFFPSKPLGCYGDGGMVMLNDDEIAQKITMLKKHGSSKNKYYHEVVGINSRLDEIQAAILLAKLKYLDHEIEMRQERAYYYEKRLQSIVKTPTIESGNNSAYAQYVIKAEKQLHKEIIMQQLAVLQIPAAEHYPYPLHQLPIFKDSNHYGDAFNNATEYSDCSLAIPFSAFVTEKEQNLVCDAIENALEKIVYENL